MSRLVKLPSGMILDADRVIFMGRDTKNIGQWVVLMSDANNTAPFVDGNDIDALVQAGILMELKAPPKVQV